MQPSPDDQIAITGYGRELLDDDSWESRGVTFLPCRFCSNQFFGLSEGKARCFGCGAPILIPESQLYADAKPENIAGHQVGGDHYRSKPIQPWDAMRAWMTPEQFHGFLRGNAIKYLARYQDKGGLEDLQKAQHYLTKLIETLEAEAGADG